jgi:hypothetical protein
LVHGCYIVAVLTDLGSPTLDGVDAAAVQLLLPETEGLAGAVADAQSGPVQVGDQWLIEVADVRVNDIEKLRELDPEIKEAPEDEAYLWVEAHVTDTGDHEEWPASLATEWTVTAADGITRYDDSIAVVPAPERRSETSSCLLLAPSCVNVARYCRRTDGLATIGSLRGKG